MTLKELAPETKACIALGYFDSVHLGHRKLIETARSLARSRGVECAVATFSNNAYKVFNKDGKQVYTFAERVKLLEGLCDSILPMRFDKRMKDREATEFLDLLFTHFSIDSVVCGYDYLFGAGARGDAELLRSYCAERGVKCVVMDKFELDGVRVSTTVVKDMLASGNIEAANTYLGAPFSLSGKIVHGRGAGRMFDIPTANIKIPTDKLLPAFGVYGTTCVIDGKEYVGATNVGSRPTFELTKTVVEIMIKDFSDNIYDKDITVCFHKFIRPVKRFETPALLSKQVHEDIDWRN